MAWKPGQSGNRSGRPKHVVADGRSLSELAREHTEKALNALVAILDDPEAGSAATISAASAILDRGHGRPRQDLGIEMKPDEATASLLEQARRRAIEGKAE